MPDDLRLAFDFLDFDEDEVLEEKPDKKDSDAAAYVEDKYEEARQHRSHIVADWVENKRFVRGDQWPTTVRHGADQDIGAVSDERADWDIQVTANAMFNVVRVLVAKLTSQDIIPSIIPVTSDEADRGKARACESLLRYFMRSEGFDRELMDTCTNVVETGTGWMRVSWDPSKGDYIIQDENMLDAQDMGAGKDELKRREGGLFVRSWSPMRVGCDPGAFRFDDARWMYCEHDMHVHSVYEHWGVDVKPDQGMSHHIGYETSGLSGEHEGAENMARVIEFWEKPSPEYPLGRYVVVSGGKTLLHVDELPDGKFPFVQFVFYPDPDSLYGITPVSFSRQMQKQINMNMSSMVMGREHSQFGKWLVPSGCNMPIPTRAPGEYLPFDPSAGRPDFVQPQPFSQQVFMLNDLMKDWFQYVVGANDATMGNTSGGTSGRAIAFQAEEDATKLGPTMRSMKNSLKQTFRLMLETWKAYASAPIKYATFGANAIADMSELDRGEIKYFDIEIQLETALPQNKQARRELVVMLMQSGIITDPQEARRLMEFGDMEDAFGTRNVDRQRALRENQIMMKGQVPVRMWEDHVIHMEVLLQHMKGAEFYEYPPQIQQNFEIHLQQHMVALQGGMAQGQGAPVPGGGQAAPGIGGEEVQPQSEAGQMASESELGAIQAIQGPSL
tara:strand:+ start:135 stop:2147 length:2013 start_codon:yes stop_codon:yes gene_type:complete